MHRDFYLIVVASMLCGMGMSWKSGSAEAVLTNHLNEAHQKIYFKIR